MLMASRFKLVMKGKEEQKKKKKRTWQWLQKENIIILVEKKEGEVKN